MPYNSSLGSSLTCGSLLHVSFLFILHAALHCSNKSKNTFKNIIVLKSYMGSHIMHLVRPYELSHCFHSPVLTLLENLVFLFVKLEVCCQLIIAVLTHPTVV